MDGSLQEELLGGDDAAVSKPGGETTWVKGYSPDEVPFSFTAEMEASSTRLKMSSLFKARASARYRTCVLFGEIS